MLAITIKINCNNFKILKIIEENLEKCPKNFNRVHLNI